METLKIKKLTDTAVTPKRNSTGAAGFDLYADSFTKNGKDENTCIVLNCGENIMVHTGISMAIPAGYVGLIYPRSGLACKKGIRLANSTGVIDEDYRGEIIVCIHRDMTGKPAVDDEAEIINKGDRIAQIIFTKYDALPIEEVDELDSTERGSNGFGSTGITSDNNTKIIKDNENDIDKVTDLLNEMHYTPTNIPINELCRRIISDANEDMKAIGAEDDGIILYNNDGTINIETLRYWMENINISELDEKY